MSSGMDDEPTGIPTRAIHEAYLDMQRSLKRHRQAVDAGNEAERDRSHGDVQETVLTFYDLLRPHIKHNNAVSDYWDGKLPEYKGDEAPDPEEGKAVIQTQTGYETLQLNREQIRQLEDVDTLREWHELLNLNGNVRLRGAAVNESESGPVAFVNVEKYQLGLRNLDEWKTEIVTTQTTMGGFLGSTTKTKRERQRVAMPKLRRAAWELSDVAQELGALSEFDASTPRTEITEELKDEIEEWRQRNID